jgi:hypothetical protein
LRRSAQPKLRRRKLNFSARSNVKISPFFHTPPA